jgi:hypothetical protein
MEDENFNIILNKTLDYLYEYYEADYSIRVCVALRPSEPWWKEPGDKLTKEDFNEMVNKDDNWNFAANVLCNYISKENRNKENNIWL